MNILALDLGSKCGWAVHTEQPIPKWSTTAGSASVTYLQTYSGMQDFSLKRGESPGMRFIHFRAWFVEMLNSVHPGFVVYEMPHNRGGYATELLNGMAAIVQMLCTQYNVEYGMVHSATLKKFATGSGRSDKEAMVAAVNKEFPNIVDDNEADAVHLLRYARENLVREIR